MPSTQMDLKISCLKFPWSNPTDSSSAVLVFPVEAQILLSLCRVNSKTNLISILNQWCTICAIKNSLAHFNVSFIYLYNIIHVYNCFYTDKSINTWAITSSFTGNRLLLEQGILTWTSSQVSLNLEGCGTGTLPFWRRSVCQREWT